MAKIGNLQVGTANIALNSCNEFFAPVSNSVTVINPTAGPNLVYYTSGLSNVFVVVYDTHDDTSVYPGAIGAVARKK
jgi:hypothetical protein